MKNARSIALNFAFLGGVISLIIAITCWFFNKPLTADVYQIPFVSRNGNCSFFSLPKLSIWLFPVIVTTITFQITYFKELIVIDKKQSIDGTIFGAILGTIFGIIIGTGDGTVGGTVDGIIFGIILGTILGTIFGIVFGTIFGIVFGTIFGTIFGTGDVFSFVLFYANLGLGEAFGLSIMTFVILAIGSLITSSLLPMVIAIGERLLLILKSPQITGAVPNETSKKDVGASEKI